jgi:hypothetical protein
MMMMAPNTSESTEDSEPIHQAMLDVVPIHWHYGLGS